MDAKRRERDARGAERAVAAELIRSGWAILGVNVRAGRLEMDVVARGGPVLGIVEVRTRGPRSWTRPLGSIDYAKRRRIRRAGERLWRRLRADESLERVRFDAASVRFDPDGDFCVEYVRGAF
ncbi:MAG: YraN family protein [Polyangiaceae bacterium]|nr:YraN family protein [Polyangiaceae bacterium]